MFPFIYGYQRKTFLFDDKKTFLKRNNRLKTCFESNTLGSNLRVFLGKKFQKIFNFF
eukprot:UN06776